jgi:hypothetical protein
MGVSSYEGVVSINVPVTPLVTMPVFNLTLSATVVMVGQPITAVLSVTPPLGYYDYGGNCTCVYEFDAQSHVFSADCGASELDVRIGDHLYSNAASMNFTNITHTIPGVKNVTIAYTNALTSVSWMANYTVVIRLSDTQ